MANLSNPLSLSNVVDYFEDEIAQTKALTGVTYGTNNKHFAQVPADLGYFYGGNTPGPSVSSYLTTSNIGSTGGLITASTFRTGLINATSAWTHLRQTHADYYIAFQFFNQSPADPRIGNSGPIGLQNGKTYMASNAQGNQFYAQFTGFTPNFTQAHGSTKRFPQEAISTPSTSGMSAGDNINITTTQNYFDLLQNEYDTISSISLKKSSYVCHNSCHYSCHTSRGRR